jgi:hypothetical protein
MMERGAARIQLEKILYIHFLVGVQPIQDLSIVADRDWLMFQFYVKNTFLNGDLQ